MGFPCDHCLSALSPYGVHGPSTSLDSRAIQVILMQLRQSSSMPIAWQQPGTANVPAEYFPD